MSPNRIYSDGVILAVVKTRSYGACLTALVLLAGGCGGSRRNAVHVSVRASAGGSASEAPSSLPDPVEVPSRLNTPVLLNSGQWDLFPPRPTDTTPLTYAEVARDAQSFNADGSPSKPIVVLARFTDALIPTEPPPSTQGQPATGGWAPQPHDQLVVALLRYGFDPIGPQGPVPQPLPTGLASYRTVIWLLDPETGSGLYGASYGGPLPPISTSPGNATSTTPTTANGTETSGPSGAKLDLTPGVLPAGSTLQGDAGVVTIVPAPVTRTPALTADDAYAAYVAWEGGAPRYADKPSLLYGLFTDTALADPNVPATYTLRYQKVPAWAVIFHDVMAVPVGKRTTVRERTDVLDVVSDSTGKVLEELQGPIAVTHARA